MLASRSPRWADDAEPGDSLLQPRVHSREILRVGANAIAQESKARVVGHTVVGPEALLLICDEPCVL